MWFLSAGALRLPAVIESATLWGRQPRGIHTVNHTLAESNHRRDAILASVTARMATAVRECRGRAASERVGRQDGVPPMACPAPHGKSAT